MYTSWDQICEDPRFEDMPYRVETDADGNIIMSPHKIIHSSRQHKIQRLLETLLPKGEAWPEVAVQTSDGVKVADVAWISRKLYESQCDFGEFHIAPEICVEVISPSNKRGEMDYKGRLFFAAGAKEFWVCQSDGAMQFHDPSGQIERSKLCPKFPIEVPKQIKRG